MIGRNVSHYRILSELGSGGMGVVYRAEDLTLGRHVAIKFLSPHLSSDPEARRRFVHEAKAASALDHSNIGTIYDIDETPDGRTFIVMAHYEGETLRARIDRGGVTIEEALALAAQIASGLAKAHEKNIVHRDIKPSNVIVTPDGQAKVMDFGLAKLAGQTKLTRTGGTLGTVAYMSPEQARGQEVDARSDIFSLGVVLYEMLAGRPPFRGDYEAALLYAVVHEEPEPLTAHRGDVPAAVQRIITKAMAKDTDARYQTAFELKRDLEAPLGSAAGTTGRRLRMTGRPRAGTGIRVWASLALVAVLVTVGAAALVRLRMSRPPLARPDLSMAIIGFRDLVHPEDPAPAAGITNLVEAGLTESSPLRPVSPERLRDIRRRLFGSGRGAIQDDQVLEVARGAGSVVFLYAEIAGTTAEPCVTWRLVETKNGRNLATRTVVGRTLADLADGIVHGVLPLLAREAGNKPPESPPSVATLATTSEAAYGHYARGLLALERSGAEGEAIAELEQAVQIDSTFALAYYRLAALRLALSISPLGHPREYAERAWAHRGHLNTKDRMRLEAFRELLNDEIPAAMDTYREVLARWPDDLETRRSLAFYLYSYWYFAEAHTVSNEGLVLYPDEPDFAMIHQASLASLGRTQEALEASLAFVRKQSGDPQMLSELGQRYWEAGLPDSTEAIVRQTLATDPGNWAGLIDLAYCAYARGDVNVAIDQLERLMRRPDLVADIRYQILYTGWGPPLVWLPAEIGRFGQSFQLLQELQSFKSARKRDVAYTRIDLLTESGRTTEAVAVARASLADMKTAQDSLSVQYSLVKALLAAGSVSEARFVFDGLRGVTDKLTTLPQKFTSLAYRCRVLLAEGDHNGALQALRELERISRPSVLRVAIQYRELLARVHWRAGRLDEAVGAYRDLLKVFGGHALSHYELGQVYEQMGRTHDAQGEYARFLAMCAQADDGWPPVADARRRLAALRD